MYYSHLYHHGIKGQKWGVRRFQNADGSLTNAGRSRYLDGDGSLTKRGAKLIIAIQTNKKTSSARQ